MEEAEAVGAAVELSGLPPTVPDELLTLYFENHRRSGGGPVLSWQRLGLGGILTFQEPADAARVLAQKEHLLHGARLSLRPVPPRAPARLLLQGLPPGTAPQHLEQYVQALLRAVGHLEQPCHVLASPRPDRALVQLSKPLSEAEFGMLQEQAQALGLEGAKVSLAWVPQAQAVRVVGGTSPVDPLLLQLYLENERRSGGAPLEGLRSLPGHLGIVVLFQQWQAAERVLQRDHRLQGVELSLVPHYDALEPEELAEDTGGGDHAAESGPGATEHALQEPRGPARALEGVGTVILDSEEAPDPSGASLRTGAMGSLGQARPVSSGPAGASEQAGPIGSPGPASSVEITTGSSEPLGSGSLGPVESLEQLGLVEKVLSMEPGAMRFIQLYHGDLLAGLGDVILFPLEGSDTTGFRLCGAPAPCQAAEEFLQSLLGSISCHVLSLKHPGSARFLLGPEGQRVLQELEDQFRCVFGTERLARDALDTDPAEVDPTEALQVFPGQSHTLWPPNSTASDPEENLSLEEVRERLATLEEWPPAEPEEEPEEQPDEEPEPGAREEPTALGTGELGWLEEEAALQLALHRSLELQGQAADQEEAAVLQQAMALSLLEPTLLEAEELLGGGARGCAQLVVHAAFDQDIDELDRALGAALEGHLWEETVGLRGHQLPTELRARLERCHGVSVALQGGCTVLRGFGVQPTRAAHHLAALLAGPRDPSLAFPLEASSSTLPQQKEPLGRLECLAKNSQEFQEVVLAFYNTLGSAQSRIRIIRVERVLHPLLQQQYELHLELLEQRCERRPVEHVLYHGTSGSAVPDICTFGFNRSFCGRNGTLYGKGVYFSKQASLSVQDRYSPPNADGHKAVFVARVLTGDFGKGHRELRAPPLRAPGHVLLRYDSAVDSLHKPNIFVIFHDTQALPTHLITCEHIPLTHPENPSGVLGHSSAT